MPRVGFEPTISAGERPKTYALDRAATGIGIALREKQIYFSCYLMPACHRFITRVLLSVHKGPKVLLCLGNAL